MFSLHTSHFGLLLQFIRKESSLSGLVGDLVLALRLVLAKPSRIQDKVETLLKVPLGEVE